MSWHGEQPLRGIVVPLVSPLHADGRVDSKGLERLTEHVIEGGVRGLFVLGTCGEGPSLPEETQLELIRQAAEHNLGRVPVLVNITDTVPARSLRMATEAAEVGAAAVVLAPPYYFPLPPEELTAYARDIARRSPLPVMLYNMPSLTKSWFTQQTLQELSQERRIVGLKDSSNDIAYFAEALTLNATRPDWTMLVGQELLLPQAIGLGAHGGICGGANIWPSLFAELTTAALDHQHEVIDSHITLVRRLDRLYQIGDGAAGTIQGLKGALAEMGILENQLAPPLSPLSGRKLDALRGLWADLRSDPLVATTVPAP